MRYALFLLSIVIFQACGNMKNGKDPVQKNPTDFTAAHELFGTVHLSDACGVSIEVVIEDQTFSLVVENLDETLQQEGQRISFRFTNSSLPMLKDCSAIARGIVQEVKALN